MPKVPITFSDELYEALRAEAERRNTTIAALVREFTTNGLAQTGITVSGKVQWGGNRKPKKSNQE
jgi:hypothetical protein